MKTLDREYPIIKNVHQNIEKYIDKSWCILYNGVNIHSYCIVFSAIRVAKICCVQVKGDGAAGEWMGACIRLRGSAVGCMDGEGTEIL